MRFGSWLFPMSQNSKNDGNVIDDTLMEIDKWESLGFDTVWLSEHHFQREGFGGIPNTLLLSIYLAQKTKDLNFGGWFN